MRFEFLFCQFRRPLRTFTVWQCFVLVVLSMRLYHTTLICVNFQVLSIRLWCPFRQADVINYKSTHPLKYRCVWVLERSRLMINFYRLYTRARTGCIPTLNPGIIVRIEKTLDKLPLRYFNKRKRKSNCVGMIQAQVYHQTYMVVWFLFTFKKFKKILRDPQRPLV